MIAKKINVMPATAGIPFFCFRANLTGGKLETIDNMAPQSLNAQDIAKFYKK